MLGSSSRYYSSSYYPAARGAAAIGTGLIVFFVIMGILGIAAAVMTIIGQWKVFKKAGRRPWECLIPVHSTWALFELAGVNPIWMIGVVYASVLNIIPFIGSLASAGFLCFVMIWLNIRVAKAFNKGPGFGVGLALLPFVWYPMLGMGPAQYVGFKKVVNKPGEDNQPVGQQEPPKTETK